MEGGATGQYTKKHPCNLRADSAPRGYSGWTVVRDTSEHDALTVLKHLNVC